MRFLIVVAIGRPPVDAAEELRKRAAYYRKLAEAEPHDEMRDMLKHVADALEEIAAIQAKKKPRR